VRQSTAASQINIAGYQWKSAFQRNISGCQLTAAILRSIASCQLIAASQKRYVYVMSWCKP
jgi:hypothetical protein